MSQLPTGTIAYVWFSVALGRYQISVRSDGVDSTYDFPVGAPDIVGFTGSHDYLVVKVGSDIELREVATGIPTVLPIAGPGVFGAHAIHPTEKKALISRIGQPFLEWLNLETGACTDTPVPWVSVRSAAFNPAGDTLFVGAGTAPFLRLYDANTFAALPNPYVDVTGFLTQDPHRAIAFNPVHPQVAMGVTGINSMLVMSTETGAYQWDVYNPDATWDYWLSFNEAGDLLSVASDAFPLATHTRLYQADGGGVDGGVIVRSIASVGNTAYTFGVFTGDGDAMVVSGHATLGNKLINGRTGAELGTLAGPATQVVTLPPYTAEIPVGAFWTAFRRSVEVV